MCEKEIWIVILVKKTKYVCDECGYEEISYNSCRNGHCPNCQIMKKLKWIEARKEEVL